MESKNLLKAIKFFCLKKIKFPKCLYCPRYIVSLELFLYTRIDFGILILKKIIKKLPCLGIDIGQTVFKNYPHLTWINSLPPFPPLLIKIPLSSPQ